MISLEAPCIEANRNVIGKCIGACEIEIDQSGQLVAEKKYVVRKEVGVDHALRKLTRPGFLQHLQLRGNLGAKSLPYGVASRLGMLIKQPPALNRQGVRALLLEIRTREMKSCERLAHGGAMVWTGPPDPQSVEKSHDGGGSAGDLAENATLPVSHRLRASDAPRGKVLHETEEKWQIAFGHALFIKRHDEIAGAGVHQKIGILHTLRDALVSEQFAKVIYGQKAGEIFRRNVGVDRHTASLRRLMRSQLTRQRKEYPLLRRRDGFNIKLVPFGEGAHDLLNQHLGR